MRLSREANRESNANQMAEFPPDHEPLIRIGFSLAVLVAMALWQMIAPPRRKAFSKVALAGVHISIIDIALLVASVIGYRSGPGSCSMS